MATKALPAPEVLRQLLRYEPDTGKLFWLPRSVDMFSPSERFSAQKHCRQWNTMYAGKQALTGKHSQGYLSGSVLNVSMFAHRVIWAMVFDVWPDQIDHVNGVRDDNRIANLRSVSVATNNKNKAVSSLNTSGFHGLYYASKRGRWQAFIQTCGARKYLGSFACKDEAVAARKAAEREAGFHENHGRQ